MRKLAFILAEISLAIDFIITFSVVLNLGWVRIWAAGGQYETFPISIRLAYIFLSLFALVVARLGWKIREGVANESDAKFALVVICIYGISIFSQLSSKSAHERLNAIPAALIAWGFFTLRQAK